MTALGHRLVNAAVCNGNVDESEAVLCTNFDEGAAAHSSEEDTFQSAIMVSVCCVCYNHAKTLQRCLESIVSQHTTFRYEILIHDDASTDGSQDIIRYYQDRYPNLIRATLETQNQYSRSMSFLKEMVYSARGRYLAYCETDDFWCDPEKLQLQVEALEAHPECSFVVHNTREVDTKGRLLEASFPPLPLREGQLEAYDYLRYELFEGRWMFQMSCVMTRRAPLFAYEQIATQGFPSSYYKVGDQPLFLFCLTEGPAWYINRDMSCYTVGTGGFMTHLAQDRAFAARVQQGYVDGLAAFNRYTEGRYAVLVQRAILRREFLRDLAARNYGALLDDKYQELRGEFSGVDWLRYRLLGLLAHVRRRSSTVDEGCLS
jgi:glycosyltransferase involved in cell wall biosynthesis